MRRLFLIPVLALVIVGINAANVFAHVNTKRSVSFGDNAVDAKAKAERIAANLAQLVYAADIDLAAQARRDGDVRRLSDLLARHIQLGLVSSAKLRFTRFARSATR